MTTETSVRGLRWPASVRGRTTLVATAVVTLVLVVGALAFVAALRAILVDQVESGARARAEQTALALTAGVPAAELVSAGDDEVIQIVGDGSVVAASGAARTLPALDPPAPGSRSITTLPIDDDTFLVVSESVAGDRGSVLVARSLDDAYEGVRAAAGLLAVGVPVLVTIVALLVRHLASQALAPVDAITSEVDEITARELHRRVPVRRTDDEVGRLATTMNRMLDRLQRAQRRQRRFVSDASHELRSPVAAIRQHAEVALTHPERTGTTELASTVLGESLRVQRLVESLLLLAQADEDSLPLSRHPVDLDDLVLDEARHLRATTALKIHTSEVSAGRVEGDPAALVQVLRNLSDNAARHAAGIVRLALRESGELVHLTVDDDGPGIPADERERVLRRFVRLDEARARDEGGAGLGLSIVSALVTAHGGTVHVGESPLGGARVEVLLPALRDATSRLG